ncbi:hypothetical protein PG984_006477 [Apiospora sp. TS-2023a]
MAANHTFPPELWEIICTELADQQDPRFHWKYSIPVIKSARTALYSLSLASKMLRRTAQPLLLRSRWTGAELGGFRIFVENILSKQRLASLVRCIEIAPCHSLVRGPEAAAELLMLEEVANRLGFDPSLFSTWGSEGDYFLVSHLSPLVQFLPCFLPKLKYLHIKLGGHRTPCKILQTLRQMSIVTPFESVTTLLLVPADGNLDDWVLQRYSPLLALLPNLRLLSLWKCDGILTEECSAREWYDSGESIVDWMPKGLQTIHMRACRLSSLPITTLLANCHSLENVFYDSPGGFYHNYLPTTPATYCGIVQALRPSKDTLRYLDLNIGPSRLHPRNYDVSNDLAKMGQVLEEFPNVTYVSANGKGYQKRNSEPFDWVYVKDTGNVRNRTWDFQFAMEQAMGF